MFDLACDFGFANHHGIQTPGDFKEVPDRLGAFLDVQARRQVHGRGGEMIKQPMNVSVDLGCDAIDLDAIAGG